MARIMIIPPQEENIKKLVDMFIQDFYTFNPKGSKEEEFDYVKTQVLNMPLVKYCPEMFMDVGVINDYLK